MNFAVSGMLWKRSLVMRDEETGSLWSHHLGRAMRGPLEGAELEMLPSTMTDWKSWKARHPKSTVAMFSRTAKRFTREFQQKAGKYVLGLEIGDAAKAYPYDTVKKTGVVNDTLGGKAVLVTYDPAGASANAFLREVLGRAEGALSFESEGDRTMRDKSSGSLWDKQSGIAIDGKLKGEMLTRLPGVPSFGRAWKDFHPKSAVYGE
jgi:hypothetical protein